MPNRKGTKSDLVTVVDISFCLVIPRKVVYLRYTDEGTLIFMIHQSDVHLEENLMRNLHVNPHCIPVSPYMVFVGDWGNTQKDCI